MDDRPCVLALQAASEAVDKAIAAGLLVDEDHPWHRESGAHPAEEAMDESWREPEAFFTGWLEDFATALKRCEIGRGYVRTPPGMWTV